MSDEALAQYVLGTLDSFESGVTDDNAARWAYTLREALLAIEIQYFQPDSDNDRLQDGLASASAVIHIAMGQLLPGRGQYRSTATLTGALATLRNGANHPLLSPAKRHRVSRGEWEIVRGSAAAAVTALVEAGLSSPVAFKKVATIFSAHGIRGRLKNGNPEISAEGVKRWFNQATSDGPAAGAGKSKAGMLMAPNIAALRPFNVKDATNVATALAEACASMMFVRSVDPAT